MHSYTLEEARTIILKCAKEYKKNLLDKKYIVIYKDRLENHIKMLEVQFGKENFQHLTGVELINKNGMVRNNVSELFFHKCINNTLGKDEIRFKKDGTTNLKLAALPVLMTMQKVTKIAGEYNRSRPYLVADKMVGNVNFCLGLKRIGKQYVPSSALLEDIKKLTTVQSQVLAILSKNQEQDLYEEVRHVSKGINLLHVNLPEEIMERISLERYIPKEK